MKRIGILFAVFGLSLFAQVAQADWTPAKRLTWNSGFSEYPAIAVDSYGNIHVVWFDNTPGNYEIYYKKSTDGGSTWMTSQRLTWNSGESYNPAIAVDSIGNPHVVWDQYKPENYEVYYRKSTDGGSTWMTSQRLTWNSGGSGGPDIAGDSSGNVHVVWSDNTPGNAEIFHKKSVDGGASWTAAKRLTWTSGESYHPRMGIDSLGHLHVVWSDDLYLYKSEIYYKKSMDGGSTWMTNQRLTWGIGASVEGAIAVDSFGNVHLVWQGFSAPGKRDIFYRKSVDGGSTWLTRKRLTWISGDSMDPGIGVDSSGSIHMAWEGYSTPGNFDIFYRKSVDGGSIWMASQRLTWNSGDSIDPAIVVDSSGYLHVVWQDRTPGNWEIYYKKYIK